MMKKLPAVAYFCMEYGLDTDFKMYAGGLGILAGDYMKGAKDNNIPIVGIGLKWKQGYGEQVIGEDCRPYDAYHNHNYDFLIDTGVKVTVNIRKRDVLCKVWKVDKFGNADIYLLDTDLPENEDAWITGQLYGWFGEERIAQEMVLGIGGVRALRKLGIKTDIYHFNEGHAVLAALELIRERMENGMGFEEALADTRSRVVFTTHTPIKQGNEEHYISRLRYMGAFNGLNTKQMVHIGGDPFNMTVAALRLSKKSNAVAALHAETANNMWEKVDYPKPIIGITNAIHIPTWVDPEMLSAADGKADLWETHMKNKRRLIDFVAERTGARLDAEVLLVGFSRRAAPYKRSNFIFSDEKVIGPLLRDKKLQIVFSGKAHPLDDTGKEIVANLVEMSRKYPNSVVFLENYDMEIGKMLTGGSDVWLNNPRRPNEASGTSGMKAAMNGVLNFSVLDGWWPEACRHGSNGWQIGDGFQRKEIKEQDEHDLKSLYKVLLEEVIPTYYDNREKWVAMMKCSIDSTRYTFSMERMLKEYFEKLYNA
ncbi:MAG TPA: alpha-glucan family phosphorylase [Negativicutes bacterium]|nr:alpha-glucan family phosphorylase [Negativicutes bacterium]